MLHTPTLSSSYPFPFRHYRRGGGENGESTPPKEDAGPPRPRFQGGGGGGGFRGEGRGYQGGGGGGGGGYRGDARELTCDVVVASVPCFEVVVVWSVGS